MNALNNELNLTMRLKCQYGSLILNVEKNNHAFLTSRLNLSFDVMRFSGYYILTLTIYNIMATTLIKSFCDIFFSIKGKNIEFNDLV